MKIKKSRTIQVRLSEDEYQIYQQSAKQAGMDMSTFIRTNLSQQSLHVVDNSQAIMREICSLHASLGGDELVSREIVEEGLQKLCLLLK